MQSQPNVFAPDIDSPRHGHQLQQSRLPQPAACTVPLVASLTACYCRVPLACSCPCSSVSAHAHEAALLAVHHAGAVEAALPFGALLPAVALRT